ncbi:alpha/beta hydrolase [Bradyrhizobium sp.]|uniref:alpha/beta hydrolase n=1 Tax=Bradyrhizobium sp. TaxID=376 RepID=UPI002D5282D6|nr:alpha/beta hydrolase [Bradyrhizobium sp.]HZR72967.1 alpha/beta hydrolase [Bradyrhizobium sp.]
MTMPFDAVDWRKLSREALDSGLNNSAAVAGSGDMVAGWEKMSADMRARHGAHLNLQYGPRERNRIDFLKAAPNAPTLLFIHGGYWQMRSKDSFTLFAKGTMAHGINVALIGYTLAPDATLEQIVAEIHSGIDYLAGQLADLGADAERLIASGWSAGGHLTAMAMMNPRIKGGVAISGIYDLEPIRHSYLNVKLGLDEAMSRRNSPMLLTHALKPMALTVGAAELPLLRKQTADFAAHRAKHGLPVTYEEIPGANHFTIMDEMAKPEGRITAMIRELFGRTA